ncbi:hypothetical protein Tco_0813374, partial [Tanacetum coccineum]
MRIDRDGGLKCVFIEDVSKATTEIPDKYLAHVRVNSDKDEITWRGKLAKLAATQGVLARPEPYRTCCKACEAIDVNLMNINATHTRAAINVISDGADEINDDVLNGDAILRFRSASVRMEQTLITISLLALANKVLFVAYQATLLKEKSNNNLCVMGIVGPTTMLLMTIAFFSRDMKTNSLLEVHLNWTYYEKSYALTNAEVFFQLE